MADNAAVVRDLVKIFHRVKDVDKVSFNVNKGESFGLLVPNGVGKTPTLCMLLKLIKPNSGGIDILGIDVLAYPFGMLKK